ncbi:MAG: serine/threonine protein kinase, partial [Candidatus Obscuribacterales bacterium]|nr:serine/threonine protein kinase [Candidatus Obscuribacterales bacterium]
LKIQYKTPWSRALFVVMVLLFPFWAIVGPAALGVMISSIIMHPLQVPLSMAIGLSFGIVAFTVSSVLLTALAEDNCIYVSKDGIAFPTFCLPLLGFRRNYSWPELKAAHVVIRELTGAKTGQLFLSFAEGFSLPLNIARIKPKDLEQFLLAVELWGSNCKRSPELLDYQKSAQASTGDSSHSGYTQMWEDELRRRFSTTAFMPLEPEHVLRQGQLKIVRQLAFGGLSAIYLAQQNGLDLVVLKEAVVPPGADAAVKEQAEQILTREAKTLSKLRHSNIARVMDHFVEDGRHYLILEYINGPDLRQYVKENGALSQVETVKWALKIADILQYLHSQDPPVIHRDLTPDNIVLCKNELYLIDFGAANQFVGAATGTVVGKQAYIPPEQLRGKSVLQSDLYAFGGTLFYLLTGKDPLALSESSPKETLSTIDSELDRIVRNCTAYEISDRIGNAEALIEALTICLEHLEKRSDLSNNISGGK